MQNSKVPFVDLKLQYLQQKEEILSKIDEVLSSGSYVLGKYVSEFEQCFAKRCNVKYAVGVASGTDALVLALRAYNIGPGDEVITVPNSFLATISCIRLVGASPILVDVGADYNINPELIEAAITPNTKAILPVHLAGRPADMNRIIQIAKKNNLLVIEDCAQAFGAKINGKQVGSFGDCGCFSFHPLKVLHCYGDGGAIITKDEKVYQYLLKARNHGLISRDENEFWSLNSRLDAVHAATLTVKLKQIESIIKQRREIAQYYVEKLSSYVKIPVGKAGEVCNYANFIVRVDKRDELQKFLLNQGIDTRIHYEKPIHLTKMAVDLQQESVNLPMTEKLSREILSLPIYVGLTVEQIKAVAGAIKVFYESKSK